MQSRKRLTDLENELMVPRWGRTGGRDSQGVWDGHGHTAVFNMENQQGLAGQHRELCSILCNDPMVTRGKDGEGIVRESGVDTDTLLCLTWRTSKDLLSSTGNSAQCHVAAWLGGEFGGKWMRVYLWLSPFTVHQKPSQHC